MLWCEVLGVVGGVVVVRRLLCVHTTVYVCLGVVRGCYAHLLNWTSLC